MFRRWFVLAMLLLLAHGGSMAEVVEEHPDAQLGRNVTEFVAKVNDGDPAQLREYVRQRYADSMLRGMTVEDSAGFLRGVHDGRGRVELCCYQLSDRIPEGMADSDHFDHTVPTPGLADGYWNHDGVIRKNTLFLAPRGTSAGGGYSTVGDLLKFDQALRSNKLLESETRDRLFEPQPERNSPNYGYGFMLVALGSDREVGHGGTFPGTTAHLSVFLDSGYTIVALCNGVGAQVAYNKALGLIERAKM